MGFLKKAQELDKIIVQKSMALLKTRGFLENDIIEPLKDDEIYYHSIFYNLFVDDKVLLYKILNSVKVWLIKDINLKEYKEYMKLYLQSNQTEHGKQVYEAFKQNPEKYYEYFEDEMSRILNKRGIIFSITEQTKEGQLIKVCHFAETNLID
jgi:hypothetical protein